MTQKAVILLSFFFFSSCQPQIRESKPVCPISADEVLSCIASSASLSTEEISTKYDSLSDPMDSEPNSTELNKLLCLSLHNKATIKQIQNGEDILIEKLKETECKQQNLFGLLRIIQGNKTLHQKYLDKVWDTDFKKKTNCKEQETVQLQLNDEIISYQRRIKDLEQQVQKLKEIESMLDNNTSQENHNQVHRLKP